jgi:ribose transport system ATP-binding protein
MRLQVQGLTKSYAVPVLKGIDVNVEAGQIYGLVGENGAGKSTFINVLCGLVNRDSGKISLEGSAYMPSNVADAMLAGVSVASQEMSLIDNLSVAQNICLRQLPNKVSWLQQTEITQRAQKLLAEFGLNDINPHALLGDLSLAQKQLVELCKALSEPCKLLILDEPTAALSQQQSDILHERMKGLAKQGMSIIYVSHRLDDVIAQCDVISVLRDGVLVKSFSASDATSELLIEHMSSGVFTAAQKIHTHENPHNSSIVLSADKISTSDLPYPISVDINAGEIVGLAGLAGAGRTELLEAIYGLTPLKEGKVTRHTNSQKIEIKDTAHAVLLDLGMLSEDRKQQGIFAQQSLDFNASIAKLSRVTSAPLNKIISPKRLQQICQQLFATLSVKFSNQTQSIEELSGGNQQKVLLARWLFANTTIFLLDEPTRGVDVATKALIYRELLTLKQKGASIVLASSELEELFTVCDRVLVMSERQIVGELQADEFNHDKVLQMAFSNTSQLSPQTVT